MQLNRLLKGEMASVYSGFFDKGVACPSCGSTDGDRIARGLLDRLLLRKRKFVCRKCRAKYSTGKSTESSMRAQSSDRLS